MNNDVLRFQVIAGQAIVKDISEFKDESYWPMEGGTATEQHSYIFGNLFQGMKKRQDLRAESKALARIEKAKAQGAAAKASLEAAKGLSKPDAPIQRGSAPKSNVGASKSNKLSTGAKIGIGIGAVAVIGLIIFIVVRKRKKK